MAIEPPHNIMKAGQLPARIKTGAKTATKTQEREMLDKLAFLADHPESLVPEWLSDGRNAFGKLARKLSKRQRLRGKGRRLRWSARGKHLWNGYAASLLVLQGQKIPSFASLKFQGRDLKFVYRTGTGRNALIGVQHFDDPQARLLGYIEFAKRHGVYLLSGDERFVALRPGTTAPLEFLLELFARKNVAVEAEEGGLRCRHARGPTWRFRYRVPDLGWTAELCLDCIKAIGGTFHEFLETRILGPRSKIRVTHTFQGDAYTLRPESSRTMYAVLFDGAAKRAQDDARNNYLSYSDPELAQWTREALLKILDATPDGYLLVGNELWLADFPQAAQAYGSSDMERRALAAAFGLEPPRLRVSDRSLHKILEPYWKNHARAILTHVAGGLLQEHEVAQVQRLPPSDALTTLARILGARERFKEFLQFDSLPPVLDFVVGCLQVQRSGEHRVLKEKLHTGARDPATRGVALALARVWGEASGLEWQYASHEKDHASFLEPYIRAVVDAGPPQFPEAIGKLAQALGLAPPRPTRTATPARP